MTPSLRVALGALVALALWSAPAAARRPPLRRLVVKGFHSAVYVRCASAGRSCPVVVALHGNFDRPEWACGAWRGVVGGRAWLLCPRGRRRGDVSRAFDRWTYAGSARLAREIDAGLAALAARYPGRVARGELVLVGFSLGATLAARLALKLPRRFRRAIMVEGGQRAWTVAASRRFARRGGDLVAFGCGSRRCRARARRACRRVKARGVWCTSAWARVGHSYGDPLPRRLKPAFDRALKRPPAAASRPRK